MILIVNVITPIITKKKKPGKSGLVGEAKSRSATAIKHDLVLKTKFSALTPFAGGKLTPLVLRGGSRLCVDAHSIILYLQDRRLSSPVE